MAKDVLIVGAGLAGLCCAHQLHKQGIPFTIYEGSDSVGGRVKSDLVDGYILDRGFQILLTAYPEAKAILDYDKLDLKPFEPGALVRHQGRFHAISDPFRRPAQALETFFSPIGTVSDKLRIGLLKQRAMASGSLRHETDSDAKSTITALKQFGFSDAIINQFFKPFLGGIFLEQNLDTTASMFDFVFKMLSDGDNVLPARGMQSIPEQIAAGLPEDKIKLSTPVAQVQGASIVLTSGEIIEGSAVVIATEEPQARKLLGQSGPTLFRSQTCLYFSASKAPVDQPVLIIDGDCSGPVNNFCVPSNVSSTYAPPGRALLSASVIGDPDMAEGELVDSVLKQMGAWFGGQVKEWELIRVYRIKYALPDQSPSTVAAVNHAYRSDVPVYTCGDYKETSSINGAMLSGRKAAEAVMADLAATRSLKVG